MIQKQKALYNVNRKTFLSKHLKEATSLSDKTFGLIKKTNPNTMLFRTRFGIHTLFLKKPIDVLILNSKLKIIKAKTVMPNKIFVYNPKYSIVIELPQGAIEKSKTKIGDQLELTAI